ncbi:hypothetical protein M513_04832 [Trichuris suis]|uniref:LEM domain-containing protein n=1 Tax=Trichuris suis TaxID=68888 RepID=A0A085MAP4_9BILA|nr:hypothetical protein M513_04832 [Trichuris suis]
MEKSIDMNSTIMPDEEIVQNLERLQIPHGPITRSTRRTYILAIEKAQRQQCLQNSNNADPVTDGEHVEEPLQISQSGRARQSGRETLTSSQKATREYKAVVKSLTPPVPSTGKKYSSRMSTPQLRQSSSVGISSASYVKHSPIVKTEEDDRPTMSISDIENRRPIQLNDSEGNAGTFQPGRSQYRLPDAQVPNEFYGDDKNAPLAVSSEIMSDEEIERNLSILKIPHGEITRSTRRSYILAIQKAKGHYRTSEWLRNGFSNSVQWLNINLLSARPTRRNGKRSKSQSHQPSLTPTLANVPSMGVVRSQKRSNSVSRSFESDRLGETREPFRSANGLLFSNCLSVITADGRDAAVDNGNDYEDSFETFNPRGNVQSRFNLSHYGLSDNIFEYGSYTTSTLNMAYPQPITRSSSWIGSMLNGVYSCAMNTWAIVKRKVGDIFYLNITKPYRYTTSSQSIYGRHERYRKWLLTGWWPILLFIFAILTTASVLCVSHPQRICVTLFAALLYGAFWDTVNVMYHPMLLPLVFVVCAFMGGYAACAYKKRMPIEAYGQHQQVVDMTETIIRMLISSRHLCLLQRCIAAADYMKLRNAMDIRHGLMDSFARVDDVRDILIPRWQRERMDPIWEKAVQFISGNEKVCHIRTKRLRIFGGKEVLVWQWIEVADRGQEEEEQMESTRMRQ